MRADAAGEAVFGLRIADRVIAFFSTAGVHGTAAAPFPQLPIANERCSTWSRVGAANATITRRLFLSEKTVRNTSRPA